MGFKISARKPQTQDIPEFTGARGAIGKWVDVYTALEALPIANIGDTPPKAAVLRFEGTGALEEAKACKKAISTRSSDWGKKNGVAYTSSKPVEEQGKDGDGTGVFVIEVFAWNRPPTAEEVADETPPPPSLPVEPVEEMELS